MSNDGEGSQNQILAPEDQAGSIIPLDIAELLLEDHSDSAGVRK